ncbi:MAG: glycosyltransferase [Bacteroidetes bacterium]|nr:glycosyltransferase [Bacteroidota bacterium]
MKTVLIISPYFPPVNAADMQRIRPAVHHLGSEGWSPVVLAVDPGATEMGTDPMLMKTVPSDLPVYHSGAFPTRWTRRIGLGAIALRSLLHLASLGSDLILKFRPDVVFFSTTQFPVMILGRYWKWRFGVKVVLDFQDPWLYDELRPLPASQRPPKYWFAHQINRLLEPPSVKAADGIVAVSEAYWQDLKRRYPSTKHTPCLTLPFAGFSKDLDVAAELPTQRSPDETRFIIRYIGRGGTDMHPAFTLILQAIRLGMTEQPAVFNRIRFEVAGTSYAPAGKGIPSIEPVARQLVPELDFVETPDRLPYFTSLRYLLDADLIFIPGSDDPRYTASKIYPYLLTEKPVLAVFHTSSPAIPVLETVLGEDCIRFGQEIPDDPSIRTIMQRLSGYLTGAITKSGTNRSRMEPWMSETMTRQLAAFFNRI